MIILCRFVALFCGLLVGCAHLKSPYRHYLIKASSQLQNATSTMFLWHKQNGRKKFYHEKEIQNLIKKNSFEKNQQQHEMRGFTKKREENERRKKAKKVEKKLNNNNQLFCCS
jgi:hypothetical protein